MGSVPCILIVDDSSDDVLLLKRAFKKAGVANPIHSVKSGREAISYLRGVSPFEDRGKHPLPSVILLDLQMPDGNGFDVLHWIRNKFPSGGLLVVVLTAVEELRKINRAYALGANSFLTKPGNSEELEELIRIFSGYWLLTNRMPDNTQHQAPFSEAPTIYMLENELVLVAEDNPDDALLLRRALDKAGIRARVKIVTDGEELLLYLQGRGAYTNRENCPLPSLIILDLKMPRRNGLEVLAWLNENRDLAIVPTIVLSASNLDEDVRTAYQLGANSYFLKPTTFDELVETMKMVEAYWKKALKVRREENGLPKQSVTRSKETAAF